ncbi:MAG: beta-ketoacyl-[acyl-carrier-protein] synthase II [Anaerolineae bacterium]|nr:MAG: beta-ketoacyl-[acyl-carrier-protein] synthase II [Anaerolineae bacterium]
MQDRKRIVITGLGCVSPVGKDVQLTWENLVAGTSGAGPVTLFDAADYKCRIAAEVKDWDPDAHFGRKEARRMDRFTQFAMKASLEALEDSGLQITDDNRHRIGAIIGSGIGGLGTISEQMRVLHTEGPSRISPFLIPMMLPDTAGGMLAIHLGIRATNLAVITACATGTNSLGEAAEVIRRGQADVMFAGGAEASVIPIAMAGMASLTALTTRNDEPTRASRPFDLDRDGFLMGEGSAILLLESLEHALARDAKIYAEVVGYGSTNDAYHITAPAENGAGAVACMLSALEDGNLEPAEIGYINAHGTSTQLNDKNETAAIKTVFGESAYSIPVSSTKSMTGHMLGASGAIEALVSVKALQSQTLPPTINYETPDPECDLDYVPNQSRPARIKYVMSNSFGFGGHNATIILGRPAEATA